VYKRAYAVALKPGLPEAVVADLVRVLEDAPQFIPGLASSVVRPALGPGPYDLIWDNAFVDTVSYDAYLSHPYHCNVIDHYMYRESAGAAIDASLCLRWSDEDSPSGAVAVVADLTAEETEPMTEPAPVAEPADGPLYLLEIVDVIPGRADEYLDAVRSDYLPMTRGRGLDLLLCLRSPNGGGENELAFLWRLAGWSTFVDFRAFFQFQNEPASTRWVERISQLRTGGRRRLMVPAELDGVLGL
jgi:hypothetical protein